MAPLHDQSPVTPCNRSRVGINRCQSLGGGGPWPWTVLPDLKNRPFDAVDPCPHGVTGACLALGETPQYGSDPTLGVVL